MSYEPEHVVCRVCRTSLDTMQKDGVVTFHHSAAVARQFGERITDHEPDPIVGLKAPDITGVCDFCSEPNPRWDYPCSSFAMEVGGELGIGMIENWGACDECHTLIEADDYPGLHRRSSEHFPGDLPMLAFVGMAALQQQFRIHRTGPAVDLMRVT